MTKVFISYAHLDSGIVLNISRKLQEDGYEVWIDKFGIQGGDLWVNEIVKGICGCDVFLLFVSSNSIRSDYVRRELDVAFNEKRKIIHVIIEHVEIPDIWVYQLAGLQYIDYQSPDWKPRLVSALGGSKPAPPQQPTTGTGKLKNPYSSLPVLELVERSLIFSNRDRELQEGIEQLIKHRLLLVTGMPGIGKSTFARALLDSIPTDSLEPFWYNFERHRSSGNTLGTILDRISGHLEACLDMEVRKEVMAFRSSPGGRASVDDVDILIDFLNQEKPIWLIFDNLETVLSRDTNGFVDDGLEILFDSLKNNTQNTKIIITNPFVPILKNGEPFLEDGTHALTLNGLDDASSVAFLRAYGVQDVSDNELMPLIREINGHPFVLNHIARYIQTIGATAAMENLSDGLEEINQRFGVSLKQRLSSQEFTALQSMTVLNREISLSGLCTVAQIQPGIVVRLREMGLLQVNEAGKFWLHNIVHNSLKPTQKDVVVKFHLRAMGFFRNQTHPSSPKSIDDYANILEWHHHAVEAGDIESAYLALYSTGLEDQLMKWNEYDLVASLCEQVVALRSLRGKGLLMEGVIKVHRTLGAVYYYLGDYSRSTIYLKFAVDLSQTETDNELKINLLIELSESYNANQEYKEAMELCLKALELMANIQKNDLQAKALHLRGIIHRDQGSLEEAAIDFEQALKIYQSINDQPHLANVTGDLGIVYYFQNLFEKALFSYKQAIISCESIGDIRGAMLGHFNVGDILLQEENYVHAEKEMRIAMELARKKKITWKELEAGLYLVEALIALSQLDEAEAELNILEPLITSSTSPCISGLRLVLYACLNWKRNKSDFARNYFDRAFEYLEKVGCEYECARAYISFAEFMADKMESNASEEALQKAGKLFGILNNHLGLRVVEKKLLNLRGQED
jgi:tetratricopeptide (TPR) repeat protein